jgi:hypothetical protein
VQLLEYHDGAGISDADPTDFDSNLDSRSTFGNMSGLLRFACRYEYAWSRRSVRQSDRH